MQREVSEAWRLHSQQTVPVPRVSQPLKVGTQHNYARANVQVGQL